MKKKTLQGNSNGPALRLFAVDDFCKKITCTQIKGVSCQHEKSVNNFFLTLKFLGNFILILFRWYFLRVSVESS